MRNTRRGFIGFPVLIFAFIALVGVSGFMYVNYNQPIVEDIQPDVEEKISVRILESNTDTSNWKIYKNEDYNFEFKIPPNTEMEGIDDLTRLTFNKVEEGTNLLDKEAFVRIIKNVNKCPDLIGGNGTPTLVENVEILGQQFLFQNAESFWADEITETYSYLTMRDNNCLGIDFRIKSFDNKTEFIRTDGSIGADTAPSYSPEKEAKVFMDIVSTFKFTDSETSDWKTYKNEKYGFEFMYPTGGVVNETEYGIEVLTPKDIEKREKYKDHPYASSWSSVTVFVKPISNEVMNGDHEAYIMNNYATGLNPLQKMQVSGIDAYGLPAEDGGGDLFVYVYRDSKEYMFHIQELDQSFRNEFLSSIKFTN